ncbi:MULTISPECIES: hypothetical protein [unclassified Streptomyces]|uniref:hypothetical protein n=1 Tax=unclassified Streptomyces TaxID=2593676 RepID=UPI0035E16F8F
MARSIEFDALLLAGATAPGADGYGARDAKVDDAAAVAARIDPRVLLLVAEAFRHGKAIGVWRGGDSVLAAVGVPVEAPGVVVADTGSAALGAVTELLGAHRVWERFTPQV